MADVWEQVAIYGQRGWYCVPLRPRSKSPSRRDWTKLRLKPEAFPENSNIGIILGEPSGWIVDVDLDCPEAIELADQYLPPTVACLLYTSPSPRDRTRSRMPSSA